MAMPVTKGSTIDNRKPEHFRTRKDSVLTKEVKGQILIDWESGKFTEETTPQQFIESNTELYGDPHNKSDHKNVQIVRAVTDKLRRYRQHKRDNPKEYW